jgi:2,3-bisphosphoglycerate-independent phosphoglycerate mutase
LLSTRTHDGDPVPYLIYDSREDSGENMPYSEEAAKGRHYIEDGSNLMSVLFSK